MSLINRTWWLLLPPASSWRSHNPYSCTPQAWKVQTNPHDSFLVYVVVIFRDGHGERSVRWIATRTSPRKPPETHIEDKQTCCYRVLLFDILVPMSHLTGLSDIPLLVVPKIEVYEGLVLEYISHAIYPGLILVTNLTSSAISPSQLITLPSLVS